MFIYISPNHNLNIAIFYKGFIMGMPGPEIMSGVLRDAGAKAVVVCLDPRVGGATADEFNRFVKV